MSHDYDLGLASELKYIINIKSINYSTKYRRDFVVGGFKGIKRPFKKKKMY